MATKLFVSYRRDDLIQEAFFLKTALQTPFGAKNVFMDVDIEPGEVFPKVLKKQLAQCQVLLAVIGPHWLDTQNSNGARRLDDRQDWVRLEIEYALARGKTVIPLLVGGATRPSRDDLPDTLHSCLSL